MLKDIKLFFCCVAVVGQVQPSVSLRDLPTAYKVPFARKRPLVTYEYSAQDHINPALLKTWDQAYWPKKRYIVHAFNPGRILETLDYYYVVPSRPQLVIQEAIATSLIGYTLLLKLLPALQYDKPVISGSLINDDKKHVFSRYGIILDVPPDNIITMFPFDAFTPVPSYFFNKSSTEIATIMKKYLEGNDIIAPSTTIKDAVRSFGITTMPPFLTPSRLLTFTGQKRKVGSKYNELFFVPISKRGHEIKVKGFFVRDTDVLNIPNEDQKIVIALLKKMAKDLNVPLINAENLSIIDLENSKSKESGISTFLNTFKSIFYTKK